MSRGISEKGRNVVEHGHRADEGDLDRGEEDEGEDADDSCFQHAPIIHARARDVKGVKEETCET